ncbi:growth/differentiation factor 8 [Drosophila simulans]|uniref:Uncharacterized protein, isoform A n=1 Tax=Drosophila simulans TaxID=7240 RepID=A0A0J9S0V9_DROSI|nr:growth/differentiation factor 8 [Drosophila simulans]XP_016037327.1 growth/differentiation factor 8 [Drosophila simulans]XP_016037328.1 growth/differentiation factor 8 [Drosophila simulans]KMZ07275.1 uncharacterized protein Dsimw501_GD27601, isoform A [Drosophila simulans]KMZ07276.1 uncharacterized protein Dsimw501_GD27601, isoform B [Drosophila simulans]KMZ07277.1 uncharacterized protein Dsimw501_GD27601, isoform C [Drosophila simulans]
MLANSFCGWKKYKTHDQHHRTLKRKNRQNTSETTVHIEVNSNEIQFPGSYRFNFDSKNINIGRMNILGHKRGNFRVTRYVTVTVLLILSTAVNAYAQPEIKNFSNSSNGVSPEMVMLSNETSNSANVLSEKNDSSSISADDKINENMGIFQMKVQSKQGKKSTPLAKVSEHGDLSRVQSVSLYRNTLINIESMLQRQLREKAKVDSIESIKMHILMRLNLKKLPNITKPISVPQNIIDNFYRDYNASSKNTVWNRMENIDESHLSINDTYGGHIMTDFSDESSSSQMQGDDANTVNEFLVDLNKNQAKKSDIPINTNDEEYESILSHISSIYIFPEEIQPHVRHNRKVDVFRFQIDSSYSDLSYATLHLYLRGWDWISAHQPGLLEEIKKQPRKDIVVTIHRAIRVANTTSFTPKVKMFEFRHSIPSGLGQWVAVDLKSLLGNLGSNMTQEILIKGAETWMKTLVVTTDNTSKNPLTVHIEIGSQKKHRRKRSVYMDCTENDHDMRCCRYPLKVNFTSFGWHFVVAPTSFDAYFCSGDCKVGYLEQYPHTHLAALTTSATPCCSPTKMSSLSLLYFDDNHNLVLSVIPNMSVEGCSCS